MYKFSPYLLLDLQKLLNQVSSERTKTSAENSTRESDFMNALKAKDSQTAILRVRLEEAESVCKNLQGRLGDYEFQLSRLALGALRCITCSPLLYRLSHIWLTLHGLKLAVLVNCVVILV